MTKSGSNPIHYPLQAWVRALEMIAPIAKRPNLTLPIVIENLAERHGSVTALLSDHECLTYRELADRSNRYARWALAHRIERGDVVCLMMRNRPEYMAIWLGITRVGGIVALVNPNLAGNSLAHAINIVAPTHVIVADVLAAVIAVLSSFGPRSNVGSMATAAMTSPGSTPTSSTRAATGWRPMGARPPSLTDPALYIYTSGTTGLPKAAIVSHFRLMQWTHWFAGMMDVRPNDRMYNCLPMYHSVGGVVATGAILVGGGSVVIRSQFSASHFWDDVVAGMHVVPVLSASYVGTWCEVRRARRKPHTDKTLLRKWIEGERVGNIQASISHPAHPRILCGHRRQRFALQLRRPPRCSWTDPTFPGPPFSIALIKYDIETGEPARNANGFCVRCTGERSAKHAARSTNRGRARNSRAIQTRSHRNAKMLRNVFEPGDAWFRTGDLMRKDKLGFFYFVDRLGTPTAGRARTCRPRRLPTSYALIRASLKRLFMGSIYPGIRRPLRHGRDSNQS